MAHRVSYELHKGPIPDGLKVLHKCDNRECTNPDHLFVGTQLDNIMDCIQKGRRTQPNVKPGYGIKNGRARFTEDEVLQIRRRWDAGESCWGMAKEFKTSSSTVWKVAVRKNRAQG